jgi:hypothetical protein
MMHLVTPPNPVILDAPCFDVGRLEQVAAVEDHRLFQACLDDTEAGLLKIFHSVTMTIAGWGDF